MKYPLLWSFTGKTACHFRRSQLSSPRFPYADFDVADFDNSIFDCLVCLSPPIDEPVFPTKKATNASFPFWRTPSWLIDNLLKKEKFLAVFLWNRLLPFNFFQ